MDEQRVGHLLVGLVVEDHELEAADAVRQPDGHERADRVGAEVGVRRAQRVVPDVDDQEPGGRGLALERHAHRLAGDAAAAVAADEIPRPDGRLGAVGECDGRGDPVGVVDVAEQGVREADVDVVEPRQPLQQLGVDQRLDEAVAPRPAEVLGARRDVGQHLARAVDHAHDVVRRGVRQDLLDDAGGLERPERFVVQADPAWVVDQLLAGVGDAWSGCRTRRAGWPGSARPGRPRGSARRCRKGCGGTVLECGGSHR